MSVQKREKSLLRHIEGAALSYIVAEDNIARWEEDKNEAEIAVKTGISKLLKLFAKGGHLMFGIFQHTAAANDPEGFEKYGLEGEVVYRDYLICTLARCILEREAVSILLSEDLLKGRDTYSVIGPTVEQIGAALKMKVQGEKRETGYWITFSSPERR